MKRSASRLPRDSEVQAADRRSSRQRARRWFGRELIVCGTLALLWCLLYQGAVAQTNAGALFLCIQPEVRSRGMGEASVALTENAFPYASNPAALAFHRKISVYAGGAKWLPEFDLDLLYYSAGVAVGLEGAGTLGFAVRGLSYGDIPYLDEFSNVLNTFHSYDVALTGTWAMELDQHLAVGTSVTMIWSRLAPQGVSEEIGSGSATAFAFDLGFLLHDVASDLTLVSLSPEIENSYPEFRRLSLPHARGFAFGLCLQNIGPNISYKDALQSDPLPRNLKMGMSYRPVDLGVFGMTFAADANKPLLDHDGGILENVTYNLGAEVSVLYLIDGRVGYINDEDGRIKTLTLGLGLGPERFRLNVSYVPSSFQRTALSHTTFVSLSVWL